jgi:hypothetical protein
MEQNGYGLRRTVWKIEMYIHLERAASLTDVNDAVSVRRGYALKRDCFGGCRLESNFRKAVRHSTEYFGFIQLQYLRPTDPVPRVSIAHRLAAV